jgi:hypothetical protein
MTGDAAARQYNGRSTDLRITAIDAEQRDDLEEADWMTDDPKYAAALSLAKEHLTQAFETFRTDPRIPWTELHGTGSKAQAQIWVAAPKDAFEHHRHRRAALS